MPPLEPRLGIRAIRPLVSGLLALGHDPATLLRDAGIDPVALDNPDARIPMRAGVQLLALAVDRSGDANLGLHLAQRADLRSADVHFYAMASSPSLGAAFERLCRYQRLIHDTSIVELVVIDGASAALRHRLSGGMAAPRQTAEFLVTSWVRVGRAVTGVDWLPAEVRFAHTPPSDASEHATFFGAPVRFGMNENALVLDRRLLDLPCTGSDSALAAMLDRYAADRMAGVPQTPALADRVRQMLQHDLGSGEPTAERVAERMKMTVRTLNRHLTAERTSFRQILDRLRHDLATRHLAAGDLAIGEVAFLLGFSELSSFHRAFKRWSGTTPARFRQRNRPNRS